MGKGLSLLSCLGPNWKYLPSLGHGEDLSRFADGGFSSKIHCCYKPAGNAGVTSTVGEAVCHHHFSLCTLWYKVKQMLLNLVQRAEVGPEDSVE